MHSVDTCTYLDPPATTKVLVGKLQRLRMHQYLTHLFVFLSILITWCCYSSVSRMGKHCPIKRNS